MKKLILFTFFLGCASARPVPESELKNEKLDRQLTEEAIRCMEEASLAGALVRRLTQICPIGSREQPPGSYIGPVSLPGGLHAVFIDEASYIYSCPVLPGEWCKERVGMEKYDSSCVDFDYCRNHYERVQSPLCKVPPSQSHPFQETEPRTA